MNSLSTTIAGDSRNNTKNDFFENTAKFSLFEKTESINWLRARFPVRPQQTTFFDKTFALYSDRSNSSRKELELSKPVNKLLMPSQATCLTTTKPRVTDLKSKFIFKKTKKDEKVVKRIHPIVSLINSQYKDPKRETNYKDNLVNKLVRQSDFSFPSFIKYLSRNFPDNYLRLHDVILTICPNPNSALTLSSKNVIVTKSQIAKSLIPSDTVVRLHFNAKSFLDNGLQCVDHYSKETGQLLADLLLNVSPN